MSKSAFDRIVASYSPEGVQFSPENPNWHEGVRWVDHPESFGALTELASYLSQLEEEGFSQFLGGKLVLSWESIYELQKLSEHIDSYFLLELPNILPIAPILRSSKGFTDQGFSIFLEGWRHEDGTPLVGNPKLNGAIVEVERKESLLPEASWHLVQAVKAFSRLPATERTDVLNRRLWGKIRTLAIAAGAGLDNFLSQTIVLTPKKLRLHMRKVELNETKVVEVIPDFDSAPTNWLDKFDGYDKVQDRYDIPERAGLVQVIIEPQVKAVLSEIKRMPGRRVAGNRAEAFIRNPFGLLSGDAGQVLSEEEFEEDREEAGIFFYRFTAQIERDDVGICGATLVIESSQKGMVNTESYTFESPDDLKTFIYELEGKLSRGMQCCAWKGWELELLGDAEDQLRTLRNAHVEWLRPRPLIKMHDVYNLSRYSERIEKIGHEKPYYSPYIARKNDEEGWIPTNITKGIFWTPEGSEEAVGLCLETSELEKIQNDIAQAKTEGKDQIQPPGFPHPITISEAESLIGTLKEVYEEVVTGYFPKQKLEKPTEAKASKVQSLVVKPNIERLDYYEERRRTALAREPKLAPQLPNALKSDVRLLDHQLNGVAWLQHLWKNSPDFCRGVLLADDMGLGKTLQLLTFVAGCLEERPNIQPVLIVAPVSLLENWNAEIKKFFKPDFFKVQTLYGDQLALKKLKRHEIAEELIEERLTRFLRPNWRGKSNIVLTTYETLRDLEFSLASEKWSIMICDEAQRVKNPNALVTRASKKQNVNFKVACTGTPVENSLVDLWCIYDFIQPGFLGALNEFASRYRRPIEAKTDEERIRVDELRKLIEPQLIRRTKREVAKDLPKKLLVDSCKGIQMSIYQKGLYSGAIQNFKSQSSEKTSKKFSHHLALLHYLKLICAAPRRQGQLSLKKEEFEDYAQKSPKMHWLISELGKIRDSSQKAIIFTEFRDIQRLIQEYIRDKFGVTPDIINGDTTTRTKNSSSRQKRIDAFQKKPGFSVIILSPLAAGVGLNIQAANHIIHYTRTWNPAKEDQATDRSYRIGQDKDVFVYCPIITDSNFKTFEKRLDELLEWKRHLCEDMLNGTGDIWAAQFGDLEDVEGAPVMKEEPLTVGDVICMDPYTFERFCALLWSKKGNSIVYLTKSSGDGGVDVVAINSEIGCLIQAKSSLNEGQKLGWDAIKDVVGGEAAYKERHPRVTFTKYSVTNQFFNEDAQYQARINRVTLIEQDGLQGLLETHPITNLELDQYILN